MALLEVIALSIDDVTAIAEGGADRIELVSALSEGGLTPSIGLIKAAVAASGGIPVMVMIRPHSNGFVYSAGDLAVMLEDIIACREAGAPGVVLGPLDSEGRIDRKAMDLLLSEVGDMAVTFHRAIDETPDLLDSVRVLRQYAAVNRVLTSGGRGDIAGNGAMLRMMSEAAGEKIRIMAGGGVTRQNMPLLAPGATLDYHVGKIVREGQSHLGMVLPRAVAEVCNVARSI